jgi:regulator of protease activity HflC (stomatin/prohibitin superfamily)
MATKVQCLKCQAPHSTNATWQTRRVDALDPNGCCDLVGILVEWVVQYRIEDPRQYLFDVR